MRLGQGCSLLFHRTPDLAAVSKRAADESDLTDEGERVHGIDDLAKKKLHYILH